MIFKNVESRRMSNNDENKFHVPVMSSEVLEYLIPKNGECKFVDCTLGFGGHSLLALRKNPEVKVLGIDQDINAINYAKERLSFAEDRILIEKGRFSSVVDLMKVNNWDTADSFLLDIGVSSPQIDVPGRGFSYRFNGPLDMRMDSKTKKTAAQILNYSPIEELIKIFRVYGEIRSARRLAEAVVERRATRLWFNTTELAELCKKVLPPPRKGGIPSPTLCFQALRIAVNGELEELEDALISILDILKPKGRVAVISYHSLEDRIVKNIFREEATNCICPPGLPVCVCDHKASLKIITKKPLIPTAEEMGINTRSRSAKMRIAEKL
jgi:16S rRNA (cytosine1402-N4)-methyltransferase